jgi:hypothetical protein
MLAKGSWQLAVMKESWQIAVGSWQGSIKELANNYKLV